MSETSYFFCCRCRGEHDEIFFLLLALITTYGNEKFSFIQGNIREKEGVGLPLWRRGINVDRSINPIFFSWKENKEWKERRQVEQIEIMQRIN